MDCKIHLCDFHWEKAWNEWLAKTEHGFSGCKEEVLSYLRSIASSSSKLVLDTNIKIFKESTIWKQSPRLQQYFTENWLPHIQVFTSFYTFAQHYKLLGQLFPFCCSISQLFYFLCRNGLDFTMTHPCKLRFIPTTVLKDRIAG